MIIKCEKCAAAFEFDENFFRNDKQNVNVACGSCQTSCKVYPFEKREKTAGTVEMGAPKKKEAASPKIRLTASALALLIAALCFNAILSLNSLEKLYVESIVSQYHVIGKDLKRNLEASLRFGKNIRKFVGMNRLLKEVQEDVSQKISTGEGVTPTENTVKEVAVSISLPNGRIIYSTDAGMLNLMLPGEFLGLANDGEPFSHRYFKHAGKYLVMLPILDGNRGERLADINITFDESQVRYLLDSVIKKNAITILTILSIGTVLLMVFIELIMSGVNGRGFPKLGISILMFLVIGISQIVFTGLNTKAFNSHYLRINKEKTKMLTVMLRDDIEYLLSKGLRLDKLRKMETIMGEIIESAPEIKDITIFGRSRDPLYMATREGVVNFGNSAAEAKKYAMAESIEDPDFNVRSTIRRSGEIEGYISATAHSEPYISTNISKDVVSKKLREIVLDSVTILMLSFLFFLELLILTFQFVEKQLKENGIAAGADHMAIRPVAFLFFFGIDLTISFVPLHMENLYEPIFGLSKDIVMGLPISMRMFFTSLSILIAGPWCDRRGWHESFLVGVCLSAAGYVYSWQAAGAVHFILSFGLVGLGYGLVLMSTQGFIVSHTMPQNRARGLAHLYAGIWAGNICGGAVGGMLAERIGYTPVFLIGAVIIFSVIFITFFFMKDLMKPLETKAERGKKTGKTGTGLILRFLFNRSILSLTLFSSLPAAIALVGFLHYFSPIFLKENGVSQSDIGRIIMIYGICMVYISPFVTRLVSGSKHTKAYIAVGGVVCSLTFFFFHFFSGTSVIGATILGVLMLGLSASFAACRNAYALNLAVSKEIGEGRAMSIFFSMARLGQIAGPILFGWLLFGSLGPGNGVVVLGVSYLVVTLFFLVLG